MESNHILNTEIVGFAFDSSNFAMNTNTTLPQLQGNPVLLEEWGEDDEAKEKAEERTAEIDPDLDDDESENQNGEHEDGYCIDDDDDEFEQYMLGEDE